MVAAISRQCRVSDAAAGGTTQPLWTIQCISFRHDAYTSEKYIGHKILQLVSNFLFYKVPKFKVNCNYL